MTRGGVAASPRRFLALGATKTLSLPPRRLRLLRRLLVSTVKRNLHAHRNVSSALNPPSTRRQRTRSFVSLPSSGTFRASFCCCRCLFGFSVVSVVSSFPSTASSCSSGSSISFSMSLSTSLSISLSMSLLISLLIALSISLSLSLSISLSLPSSIISSIASSASASSSVDANSNSLSLPSCPSPCGTPCARWRRYARNTYPSHSTAHVGIRQPEEAGARQRLQRRQRLHHAQTVHAL